MAKVWERGGIRVTLENGDVVVVVDADQVLETKAFDAPPIAVYRVPLETLIENTQRELGRFWRNVVAEARRVAKRLKKKPTRKKKR